MMNKEFVSERLELFAIYVLAASAWHIDVKQLTPDNISAGNRYDKFTLQTRQNRYSSKIPLLPMVQENH
jgi:hypothetical protein